MKDKDFWWAVLVEAEVDSERLESDDDGSSAVLAMKVANHARRELVRLGLNLDEICPHAAGEYRRLFRVEVEKNEAERQRRVEMERTVREARELLERREK